MCYGSPLEKEEYKEEDSKYRYSLVTLPSNGKIGYPADVEYRDIVRDLDELQKIDTRS